MTVLTKEQAREAGYSGYGTHLNLPCPYGPSTYCVTCEGWKRLWSQHARIVERIRQIPPRP